MKYILHEQAERRFLSEEERVLSSRSQHRRIVADAIQITRSGIWYLPAVAKSKTIQ